MFTRKELNYLRDPYFRIIREEDQYIEVQSCNTGHCWTVFKNQFEAQYKVTLYHKHKFKAPYYHKHRQCRTVINAIEQIKSHDEYVLEQEALKKERESKATEHAARHLKVHQSSGYKYKPTPEIVLKCDWLNAWDLNPAQKWTWSARATESLRLQWFNEKRDNAR